MTLQVELQDDQAWALAEFLKRVGYGDYRPLAISEQEACDMVDAGEKVRAALAEQGYMPR
jgi:hypothetical protein